MGKGRKRRIPPPYDDPIGNEGSAYTRHLRFGENPYAKRDAPLSEGGRYVFWTVLTVVIVTGVVLIVWLARG